MSSTEPTLVVPTTTPLVKSEFYLLERLQFLIRFAKKQEAETRVPKPKLTRAQLIAKRMAEWNRTHNDGSVRSEYYFIVPVAVNADGDFKYGMIGNPIDYNPFHIPMDTPSLKASRIKRHVYLTPIEIVTEVLEDSGYEPEDIDYFLSLKKKKEIPFYVKDEIIPSNGCIFRKKVFVLPVQEKEMSGMHFETIEKWSEDDKKVRATDGYLTNNICPHSLDILKFIAEKLSAFK